VLEQLTIERLSLDGRGVARADGKTVFVEGALPGECVDAKLTQQHKRFDEARLEQLISASSERVEPGCKHYGDCGGCQLQHLSADGAIDYKARAVSDQIAKLGGITPPELAAPITSQSWHYRRSARIGLNQLAQGGSLAGFRRAGSNKLCQIDQCQVLRAPSEQLFDSLREMLDEIDQAKSVTQVEFIAGDNASALVFRVKGQLTPANRKRVLALCEQLNCQGYLQQSNGLEALADYPALNYQLDDLTLEFKPGDFLQINPEVNQAMVAQALDWLELDSSDKVLDLFCGLGNFSLPLAKRCAQLTGVEGSEKMVERASHNAEQNGIDNSQFYCADLSQPIEGQPWASEGFDKVLLDPPRQGAGELINALLPLAPKQMLYIACDPVSLARDTQSLTKAGYQMTRLGVLDMFPQTHHVEAMALFTRADLV